MRLGLCIFALLVLLVVPVQAGDAPSDDYVAYLPLIDRRGNVFIQNTSTRTRELGLFVHGEVYNGLSNPIDGVRVTASFFDAQGVLLSTSVDFIRIGRTYPGETVPFGVFRNTELIEGFSYYLLSFTYSVNPSANTYPISVPATNIVIDNGQTIVQGTVRNAHPFPLENVSFIATLYDADGRVVAFAYPQLDPFPSPQFAPGATLPYRVVPPEFGLPFVRAVVRGEGTRGFAFTQP